MQIPLANIHCRFLLVRDDWGFQVNPLCRHDITRSDRQIGNLEALPLLSQQKQKERSGQRRTEQKIEQVVIKQENISLNCCI